MKILITSTLAMLLCLPAAVLAEKPGWTGKGSPEKADVEEHKETMNAKHEIKKASKTPKEAKLRTDPKPGKLKGPKPR